MSKERKVELNRILGAIDKKNRGFLRSLSDDERKGVSPYLALRYSASVDGDEMLQAYYLLAANKRANRGFFNLSKHPELQWLLITTVSPGMGTFNHYWVAPKKAGAGFGKAAKFLEECFPYLKEDEVTLMAEVNSIEDIRQLARDMGMDDKEIKAALG